MKFIGILLLSSGALAQNCPLDIKTCPDGQTLNRNPTDNCNFPLCAGEQDCTSASTGTEENTLLCPSGTLRKRDGFNNCEFEQCDDPRCELEDYKQCPAPYLHMYRARDPTVGPSGCDDWLPCPASTPDTSACPQDVKTCPDGQTLNRNPTDNCNFPLCAGEQDCSSASTGTEENTLLCPSGTLRKRDGFNNCEFEQCDDPRCELEDYKQCPAPYLHMYRARDPTVGPSGCADWLPCPTDGTPTPMANDPASADAAIPGTTSVCPQDVKTCPDGQTLNRNPTDNCNFPLCAGESDCTSASTGTEENTLLCPSGTLRKRDGFNNCEFEQCDDPRCELEDYKQCPAPYLHMYRARDPTVGPSGCDDWLPCPDPMPMPSTTSSCPQDVKTCPDGQTLNRNPTDNCNFPLCAGESDCSSASTGTEENTLLCPSGTLRKRDGFNNCEFEQCDDPRCELEDYKQCSAPYLHMYRARDPNAGSSGCADWLPCPTDGTPTPMANDPATEDDSSEDDSSGAIANVGVVASAAVAAGLTMMM